MITLEQALQNLENAKAIYRAIPMELWGSHESLVAKKALADAHTDHALALGDWIRTQTRENFPND